MRKAALVAMSTHLAVSGLALPSKRPGISLNCLLISFIISKAASPTAVMVIELTKKGKIPPRNIPHKTSGSLIANTKLSSLIEIFSIYALIKAKAAKAAALIAKPFPMAAVVLPTASNLSVRSLTSGGNSAISAIPPALSDIGP